MIDWSSIRPVLVAQITSIATDPLPSPSPAWSAEWADRHRDYISPDQEIGLYLKVTSCVTVNEDEDRYDTDDAGNVLLTQVGLRRFVLNIQAEVSEDEDGKWALQTLERIRTRVRRPAVLDALLDVNVALIEAGNAQNISATFDKRVWSIATLDVTFTAAVNDTDPIPVGSIAHVVISSSIDGALSNLTNEDIPS